VSTDAELLSRWRDGEEQAGRELLLRYFEGLMRFFRGKVTDGVDDLIQRTMLLCLENADKLREAASSRAYVYAVARNELYRHLRDRMKEREAFDANVTSLNDVGLSPSRVAAQREDEERLLAAIRRIPVDYQVTLELYYWEGMTYLELADVLGIHRETVKSRLKRAKQLIREHMESASLEDIERWARSALESRVASEKRG
jgi:RNA polymerase sigma-70 factor (ECF subfamily)